ESLDAIQWQAISPTHDDRFTTAGGRRPTAGSGACSAADSARGVASGRDDLERLGRLPRLQRHILYVPTYTRSHPLTLHPLRPCGKRISPLPWRWLDLRFCWPA